MLFGPLCPAAVAQTIYQLSAGHVKSVVPIFALLHAALAAVGALIKRRSDTEPYQFLYWPLGPVSQDSQSGWWPLSLGILR